MKKNETTNGRMLLDHVWKNSSRESWDVVNNSMNTALYLAVTSGMELSAQDLRELDCAYRARYWFGANGIDMLYASAVFHENTAVIKACEECQKIEPYFANNVEMNCHRTSRHHSTSRRNRERLTRWARVRMPEDGGLRVWEVTEIGSDFVRFVSYKPGTSDKERRLLRLSRGEIAAMFPPPKRKEGIQQVVSRIKKSGMVTPLDYMRLTDACKRGVEEFCTTHDLTMESQIPLAGALKLVKGRHGSEKFLKHFQKARGEA